MRICKAISNPFWALRRFKEKYMVLPKFEISHKVTHSKFVKNIIVNADDYATVVSEIVEDHKFNASVNQEFVDAGLKIRFPCSFRGWPITLYYLIRKLKPNVIIETGVFYGISSSCILSALHRNKYGILYSIDLPAYFEKGGYYDRNPYRKDEDRVSSLPEAKEPGFIVPQYLKTRWNLLLGSSTELLPKLLNKLCSIDMFLHDSLHSYENMIFEYSLAYESLKKGGYIFSDNIDWNPAFYDFCNEKNCEYCSYLAYYESTKLLHNFGYIRKS